MEDQHLLCPESNWEHIEKKPGIVWFDGFSMAKRGTCKVVGTKMAYGI